MTIHQPPTHPVLASHFAAVDRHAHTIIDGGADGADHYHHLQSVMGLIAYGQDELCRWGMVDLDQHGPAGPGYGDPATDVMLAYAMHLCRKYPQYHPIIELSNGRGGYHIWWFWDKPYPKLAVAGWLRALVADWQAFGLVKAPECYPGTGWWVRLPGLHHSLWWWSCVWDWESGQLLDLEQSVQTWLHVQPVELEHEHITPAQPPTTSTRTTGTNGTVRTGTSKPYKRGQQRRAEAKAGLKAGRTRLGPVIAAARATDHRRVDWRPYAVWGRDTDHICDYVRAARALRHYANVGSSRGAGQPEGRTLEEWLRVGRCLAELGWDGLLLWHRWSTTAPELYAQRGKFECGRQWGWLHGAEADARQTRLRLQQAERRLSHLWAVATSDTGPQPPCAPWARQVWVDRQRRLLRRLDVLGRRLEAGDEIGLELVKLEAVLGVAAPRGPAEGIGSLLVLVADEYEATTGRPFRQLTQRDCVVLVRRWGAKAFTL